MTGDCCVFNFFRRSVNNCISTFLGKTYFNLQFGVLISAGIEFMDLDSVSVHKHGKKNLANIQPS